MEKLQIGDIVIRYKSLTNLEWKIERALDKVHARQEKLIQELRWLKRKEKTLKRFLGLRGNKGEMEPYAIETVNSRGGQRVFKASPTDRVRDGSAGGIAYRQIRPGGPV